MSLQRWAWDRWESPNSNSGLIPKPMCSLSVRIHNLCYPNFTEHDVKTSTRVIWLQLPPHKTPLILLSHIGRCLKETMARQPPMQECDTVFSWGHCGLGERGHVCWEWSMFRFSDEEATLWTWTRHLPLLKLCWLGNLFIYKVHWLHSLGTGETFRWNHLEMRGKL